MKKVLLSPEISMKGIRCSKSMYLSVHHPELAEYSEIIISPAEIQSFKKIVRELIAPGGNEALDLLQNVKVNFETTNNDLFIINIHFSLTQKLCHQHPLNPK